MKHAPAVEQTVKELFAGPSSYFTIPYYQRPYVWSTEQCEELWDDLIAFCFPDNKSITFDRNKDRYFLGLIVTLTNRDHQDEIIDGQQRITSLFLLARAVYDALDESESIKHDVGKCIWEFDEYNTIFKDRVKINAATVFDRYTENFHQILISGGTCKKNFDSYSVNFRWFQDNVSEFQKRAPQSLPLLASRLINNVYVIKLSTNEFDDAYQLFQTINAKGEPLAKTDIFKAKLCQYAVGDESEKNKIATKWETIANRCEKIFLPKKSLSPIEYIFFLYTYKFSNASNFRRFHVPFLNNESALLKDPKTLQDIDRLLDFLLTASRAGKHMFISEAVQRKVFILLACHVNIWKTLTRFYFANRDATYTINNEQLDAFLERLTAVVIGLAASGFYGRSLNQCLSGFLHYINNGDANDVEKFQSSLIRDRLIHFYNVKAAPKISRILLFWWTFKDEDQPLIPWRKALDYSKTIHTEHIFAKAIAQGRTLNNPNNVELLGNLALLEATINQKARALSWQDKVQTYRGAFGNRTNAATFNTELLQLAESKCDFGESDILERNQKICSAVIELLASHQLLDNQSW